MNSLSAAIMYIPLCFLFQKKSFRGELQEPAARCPHPKGSWTVQYENGKKEGVLKEVRSSRA